MDNTLRAQAETTITDFMRNCHQSGEAKVGRISAERFLADNDRDWHSASSEFLDHYSICCYHAGDLRRSFEVTTYLLEYRPLLESDRKRVDVNRHFSIAQVKDDFIAYPAAIVKQIQARPVSASPQITFGITTCKRTELFINTMNSFLQCCQDIALIDEWLCVDDNTDPDDRAKMRELYPFFRFIWKDESEAGHARSMNLIRQNVRTPYLFHCEDDWQFFCPKAFLGEALEILHADERVGQVLINRNYAREADDHKIKGGYRKKTAQGVYYIEHEYYPPVNRSMQEFMTRNPGLHNSYWGHFSLNPSLMRMDMLTRIGEFKEDAAHFEMEYAYRYVAAGYRSSFFSTMYCLHSGGLTDQQDESDRRAAEIKNQQPRFSFDPPMDRRIRIKPSAWWCDSRKLCEILNAQSQGLYQWNNLELTWEDDADYFAIFQAPYSGEYFIPERSVFFQTEALAEEQPARWGEEWSNPDPRHFLQVRKYSDFPNYPDWHIGLSYTELFESASPEKTKLFSAIVSSHYSLPGHIKRVDFLKYYEQQSHLPPVDIYGYDNSRGFQNYRGALPDRDKSQGLIPYRYTFNAENHSIPNYFTEKIVDAILAETLCFYWGCENLDEFIDPRSYIRLDLDDLEGSAQIIRAAIENDEWSKRLPFIREQKRRILESMHFLPLMEKILQEAAIPAYVINLDRRPDRWQKTRKNLQPHWQNFTRYPAQDGKKLELTRSQKAMFAGNKFENRQAVIACALSHMDLWRQLSEDTSREHYLILEDDVEFCQDFAARLHEVERIVRHQPWDLIFLGSHIRRGHRPARLYDTNAGIVHLSQQPPGYMLGGTFAYLISQAGAQKLLHLVETEGVQYPIDTLIMLHFDRFQVYFAEPHLVFSEYFFPDSAGEQVDTDIQKDFTVIE